MKISLRLFGARLPKEANSGACDIFIEASERPFEGLSSGLFKMGLLRWQPQPNNPTLKTSKTYEHFVGIIEHLVGIVRHLVGIDERLVGIIEHLVGIV
jgi:hypothetical protein